MNKKIKIAIVGVGNCASSLVQGIEYYKDAPDERQVVGLMHTVLGGYRIADIEVVAAFDVNKTKVGKDLGKAIYANPNNTKVFQKVGKLGVIVQSADVLDGIGQYVQEVVIPSDVRAVDPLKILKESGRRFWSVIFRLAARGRLSIGRIFVLRRKSRW